MLRVLQVAGFFVQTIPDWIGWLKYTSFIYYGYNTLLKVLLQAGVHRVGSFCYYLLCLLLLARLSLTSTYTMGLVVHVELCIASHPSNTGIDCQQMCTSGLLSPAAHCISDNASVMTMTCQLIVTCLDSQDVL